MTQDPTGGPSRPDAPDVRSQDVRPRTGARLAAVQALFQSEQNEASAETVIDEFIRHRLGASTRPGGLEDGSIPQADVALFARIVRTAVAQREVIDQMLSEALPPEWPFGRLDPVLRALLRAGGAELAQEDGPPTAVVINEYLDVAHGFFIGEEPRMANGLLDRLARRLRPLEFPAPA